MHRYGAKLSIQINHAGASAMSSRIGGLQPVSSSNIPSKTGGAVPRPLSKDEILAIVKNTEKLQSVHRLPDLMLLRFMLDILT